MTLRLTAMMIMRNFLGLGSAPILVTIELLEISERPLHPKYIALRIAPQGYSVAPPPMKEHPARGKEGLVREIPVRF